MLKHVDYFIPAYVWAMHNQQPNQTCSKGCCGHHRIPFFPTLSLPSCVPSQPSPPTGGYSEHSQYSCAWKLLYTGGQTSFGDKHRWAVHSCLPTEKNVNIWCWGDSSHICFSFSCNLRQPSVLFPELSWILAEAKMKQLVSISSLLMWLYLLRAAASSSKQHPGNKYLCFQASCLQ